jgi:hypothetical protein
MYKKLFQTIFGSKQSSFVKGHQTWSNGEMTPISKCTAKKLTMGTSNKKVESAGSSKRYANN